MRQSSTPRLSQAQRVRRVVTLTGALVFVSAAIASAHDMFVKPNRFFLAENSETLVRVLNGTFSKSENSITRDRIRDIAVVSPSGRQRLDTSAWSAAGDTSTFTVRTGRAGTYVLGFSTTTSVIGLSGKEFNLYLQEDGIPDVLAARRRAKELGDSARERYSKHVKAFLQVGAQQTDAYTTELGYPAELIPLSNPYSLKVGDTLRVRTLVDGKPAANQYVLYGGRTTNDQRINQRSVRSGSDGVARIPVRARGTWYVKFINMARMSGDATADYESKWATITVQLR
jgi:uncharacterized GH25 family protein